MRLAVLAGLAALALAGCDSPEDARARVNSQLPAGCQLKELGSYGRIDSLVIIICDGTKTAALNYTESHSAGKFRRTEQKTVLQVGLQ